MQKVAIIGSGYSGLAAALELQKKGFEVIIYDRDLKGGGLASGFEVNDWNWSIERFYHHWFTNDDNIIWLADETGLRDMIVTYTPRTSILLDDDVLPFDSPHHILMVPGLNLADKFKLSKALIELKLNKSWKRYENQLCVEWMPEKMGVNAYERIWKPMLIGKWGDYYDKINMAWFWARIHKRTRKLMYPEGGYQNFTDNIIEALKLKNVKIKLGVDIKKVRQLQNGKISITLNDIDLEYDKVLCTVSPNIFSNLVDGLTESYTSEIRSLTSIGAVCMLLIMKKRLMKNTYWLNIPAKNPNPLENDIPFLVCVEHTNMLPHENYSGKHIIYCANYLVPDHKMLSMSDNDIFKLYLKGLKNINSDLREDEISEYFISRTDYASPVFLLNHSKSVPDIVTPIKNVYWASMSHVYPWDRGTNYAVGIGREAANIMMSH